MIDRLFVWLTVKGLLPWQAKIVVGVGVAIFLATSFVAAKLWYDSRIISKHESEIVVRLNEDKIKADEKAFEQRMEDKIELQEMKEKFNDAIESQTDSPIPDSTRAFNCTRLRKAGQTSVPSCQGY